MMTPILTSEQPPVAHRPAIAPHQQYVQWTEHHQQQAQGLPPCAIHLWQYLLYKYPGGVPQEIDLEEIRFEISAGRSKTYCVQSLKNALWKYLVPQGLVAVVKQFTKRIMRVVANHAGPIKEIGKRFELAQSNLHFSKLPCKSEPESIEVASSLQSFSESTLTHAEEGDGKRQELKEIRGAIAEAPFMQKRQEPEPAPAIEPPDEDKLSPGVARTILERLRDLGIPSTTQVRSLVAKTPEPQLELNVLALEEEAFAKGLKSPIAAFKYFVVNNVKPRSERQSWWNRAAAALGREQRDSEAQPPLADRLIQSVTEYWGEVVVIFTNGQRLALAQAQGMSWEAIALVGGES